MPPKTQNSQGKFFGVFIITYTVIRVADLKSLYGQYYADIAELCSTNTQSYLEGR